ncbi:MAG: allophanate hydrolase [Candidatus Binatia bacterium]
MRLNNRYWLPQTGGLDFTTLQSLYREARLTPTEVVHAVYDRIAARGEDHVWIHLCTREQALAQAQQLEHRQRQSLQAWTEMPLYGLPFAVKDNIDVAGLPTTAACPQFAYTPETSAPVVERLLSAGGILVGKNNLDQFATGLAGVRSPFGIPKNPFDEHYIPGGSSSGSAVAVAAGLVSFALGTDTAGSGRVPAALNNLIGLKPSRGLLSTRGVVPACRSLDCVSVLALTCADARLVLETAKGFDSLSFSARREADSLELESAMPPRLRYGVPAKKDLCFFEDAEAEQLFDAAVRRLRQLGDVIEIDFAPFRATANLLYNGPWVAERLAAIQKFYRCNPEVIHPIVRGILAEADRYSALDLFCGLYQLEAYKRRAAIEWAKMDVLVVPTVGAAYTIAKLMDNPLTLNANLGYYTNFVNLLDCCALAVPSGLYGNGLPFGISFIAPALQDGLLCALGAQYHQLVGGKLGATRSDLQQSPDTQPVISLRKTEEPVVRLAVVGAHLSGQPLNYQLLERGARLVRACRTHACYRLYALANTTPLKPGLVRSEAVDGVAVTVEVWEMPVEEFGSFVAQVPAPLSIGSLLLEDGQVVKGFLCEEYAIHNARDISSFGGWREFLQHSVPGSENDC